VRLVQVQLATQHERADAVHPAEVGFLTQEFVEIRSSRAQSRAVWSRHQGLTRQTDVDGSAEHLYYDKQQVSRVEHVGCSVDGDRRLLPHALEEASVLLVTDRGTEGVWCWKSGRHGSFSASRGGRFDVERRCRKLF